LAKRSQHAPKTTKPASILCIRNPTLSAQACDSKPPPSHEPDISTDFVVCGKNLTAFDAVF
jgi:hypothetical protein